MNTNDWANLVSQLKKNILLEKEPNTLIWWGRFLYKGICFEPQKVLMEKFLLFLLYHGKIENAYSNMIL